MAALQQVHHFVYYDALQALRRFLGELRIDPDAPRFDVARSPARSHLANTQAATSTPRGVILR